MSEKPTNPKDIIGSDKLPLHLWPTTATAVGSLAMLDGCLKYGRSNFRAVGVKASIYYDAAMRHLNAWFEGEELDPDSGIPHLGHALACIAILVEAEVKHNLNDDRQYPTDYRQMISTLTPMVKALKEKHAGKTPTHYVRSLKQRRFSEPEPAPLCDDYLKAYELLKEIEKYKHHGVSNDLYIRIRNFLKEHPPTEYLSQAEVAHLLKSMEEYPQKELT